MHACTGVLPVYAAFMRGKRVLHVFLALQLSSCTAAQLVAAVQLSSCIENGLPVHSCDERVTAQVLHRYCRVLTRHYRGTAGLLVESSAELRMVAQCADVTT